MKLSEITSLNEQIQEMVKGMNLPEDAARIIMEGIAHVKWKAPCKGLSIGQKAPDFRLKNQHDDQVSLSETLAASPVVLKFIRGAWCPFCNLDVAALQRILPQLEELSATVLVINPQKSDKSQALQTDHSLGFDILSDEDQQVIRAYQCNLQFPLKSRTSTGSLGSTFLNLPPTAVGICRCRRHLFWTATASFEPGILTWIICSGWNRSTSWTLSAT